MRYRSPRKPCDFPVIARLYGRDRKAMVRDLSESGARIVGLTGAEVGDVVTLLVAGSPLPAKVLWRNGSEAGLNFSREVGVRLTAKILRSTRVNQRTPRCRVGNFA